MASRDRHLSIVSKYIKAYYATSCFLCRILIVPSLFCAQVYTVTLILLQLSCPISPISESLHDLRFLFSVSFSFIIFSGSVWWYYGKLASARIWVHFNLSHCIVSPVAKQPFVSSAVNFLCLTVASETKPQFKSIFADNGKLRSMLFLLSRSLLVWANCSIWYTLYTSANDVNEDEQIAFRITTVYWYSVLAPK